MDRMEEMRANHPGEWARYETARVVKVQLASALDAAQDACERVRKLYEDASREEMAAMEDIIRVAGL